MVEEAAGIAHKPRPCWTPKGVLLFCPEVDVKVLVCGGRDLSDVDFINRRMDRIHAATPITTVVHGDARGADRLAGKWAELHGIPEKKYPADWKQFPKSAGPIRNGQMLTIERQGLERVIAFPGGNGTFDMVDKARRAGVPVQHVTGRYKLFQFNVDRVVMGVFAVVDGAVDVYFKGEEPHPFLQGVKKAETMDGVEMCPGVEVIYVPIRTNKANALMALAVSVLNQPE